MLVLQAAVVKLGSPKTPAALGSLVKGCVYSSTRLLSASATHTLPFASTVTSRGAHRRVSPAPHVALSKLGCPRTRLALMPEEKGGLNSSTRLPSVSATNRLPVASTARLFGSQRLPALVLPHFWLIVKLG